MKYAQVAKDGRVWQTEAQPRRRLLKRKIEIVGFGAAKTFRQACIPFSTFQIVSLFFPVSLLALRLMDV